MEKTYKRVPFDIKLAKKITNGDVEGRIVTNSNHTNFKVDIIKFDVNNDYAPIIGILTGSLGTQSAHTYSKNGKNMDCRDMWGQCCGYDLFIELPEEAPKHEFKVGDKVRVVKLPFDSMFDGAYLGKEFIIKEVKTTIAGDYVIGKNGWKDNSFPANCLMLIGETECEFKPFDRVLVRNKNNEAWQARTYDQYLLGLGHGCQDNLTYEQCIPYKGNENLIGTTNDPNYETN